MRRYPSQAGRIGIVCFNDACDWNWENPPSPHRVPLPFLLTDDTIYQRAPAVVLGTIDKLALIGQHDRTINAIVGMLGVARLNYPRQSALPYAPCVRYHSLARRTKVGCGSSPPIPMARSRS